MPLIPSLGWQKQADFWVRGQPGLHSEFQDSQGYTEKPCLKKNKKENQKPKTPPQTTNQPTKQTNKNNKKQNNASRISLYCPDCPRTHSVDQAGLRVRNLLASASKVLGLKVCTTTAQLDLSILCICIFILCIWIHCFHTHQRGHRLPSQMVVNHQVVAGSWTQELCKNSYWS